MPIETSKLKLLKPVGNETVSRLAYNANLDLIDQNAASQAELNTHKTATTLDHPDGSVTAAKLAQGAVLNNLGYTPVNKAGDTMTGKLTINQGSGGLALKPGSIDTSFIELYADSTNPNTRSGYIGYPNPTNKLLNIRNEVAGADINFAPSGGGKVTVDGRMIWHSGNHGSGSGLDADKLDGKEYSQICIAEKFNTQLQSFEDVKYSEYNNTTLAIKRDFTLVNNIGNSLPRRVVLRTIRWNLFRKDGDYSSSGEVQGRVSYQLSGYGEVFLPIRTASSTTPVYFNEYIPPIDTGVNRDTYITIRLYLATISYYPFYCAANNYFVVEGDTFLMP